MEILRNFMCVLLIEWLLLGSLAGAALKTDVVEYQDGKTSLQGSLVYDDTWSKPRPAVVIIHQWMGPTEHEKMYAQHLAELGYVAFVADIFGKGVRPTNADEAGKVAAQYKSDIKLFRQRIKVALDRVAKNKMVDVKKLVVMGFCFGGTGALEAARGGLPIVAAVSFHGGLATPQPQNTRSVKAKLLVLHGAIDPYVPSKEVDGFMKEMNEAKADFQFIAYSGAVHGFTQRAAGADVTQGVAFNEVANRRSWEAFKGFLNEVAPVTK